MNRKGQLLTLDLLLALVPLTIILGMSASALGGVVNQIQEYAFFYSMQRQASDAIDVLIKTPGVPPDWSSSNPPVVPGLANYTALNKTEQHYLDSEKVSTLDGLHLTLIPKLIGNVSYYNLSLTGLTNVSISKSWSNGSKSSISNIVIIERTAYLWNTTNSTEVRVTLEVGW